MTNPVKKVGNHYKDAVTGRFVTEEYARENPSTTFAQKVKKFFRKLLNKSSA